MVPMRHRIHLLLDRSGSMESYRRQTIDAVNGYLAALRADPLARETAFSLTIFDSGSIDTLRRGERGSGVRNLTAEEFQPRAATPLYDAVGHVLDIEARNPVSGRRAIVVVTDGAENGSRRLKSDDVRRLVEERERQGWVFIFLGANQDATREAAKVGVPERRAISYRAGSGASAAATFAAAAAVSFACFTLRPGEAAAAVPGFTDADRHAAFDGADDWRAEMSKDIADAPVEPAGIVDAAWGGTSHASATTDASMVSDGATASGPATDEEGGSLLGSITGALGAVLSIFGGSDDSDSGSGGDSGSDAGGDGGGGGDD